MADRLTRAMIARCPVALVTEGRKMRELQVSRDGEPLDGVEHFEPYGLSSRPVAGAEALVLAIGGASDHPVACVVADRTHRPTDLEAGEVCIWDDLGQELRLSRTRVEITGTAGIYLGADVTVGGSIDATSYKVGGVAGVTGTFTDADTGYVINVVNGIVVGMGVPAP